MPLTAACSSAKPDSDASSGGASSGGPSNSASDGAGGSSASGLGGAGGAGSDGTAGAAGGAVVFTPGVFSLTGTGQATGAKVYANPNVAGAAIGVRWSTVEATEGQFDWTYLDEEVHAASSAGKKIALGLGNDLPQWVVDQGAQTFSFTDPNPYHSTYGQTLVMALPWDPVFLAKWTAFVKAVGAHYGNEPTIAYLRGASESVTNGWGLATTDTDMNTWSAYGYTPGRLLTAMETVVDAFMTSFPNTPEWIEVGTIPFEPQVSGEPPTYVAGKIADYGFATYANRFGVWREDISPCTPDPPTSGQWQILWDHKGRDGAQMLWKVTDDGPDFRMNKCNITPNDEPTILRAAVQRGLDYGMHYLEIYSVDVTNKDLDPVLQFAAENLSK